MYFLPKLIHLKVLTGLKKKNQNQPTKKKIPNHILKQKADDIEALIHFIDLSW